MTHQRPGGWRADLPRCGAMHSVLRVACRLSGRCGGSRCGNTTHRWLDDAYQLPAVLTNGHNKIVVTITPVSGTPPWSAAIYTADCVRTAPGAAS